MAKQIQLTGKQSDFSGIVLKTAAQGDLNGVKWLVAQNRAWVHQVGPHGRTMLWEAAYKGRLAVVEYLMDCGAELDQPGCYYTPMLAEVNPRTAAVLMTHTLVAQALEKRGARIDFHDACYLGDASFVHSAIKKDRSIVTSRKPRSSDPAAATPIFYAVAGVHPEIVRTILSVAPKKQARDGLLLRWALWQRSLDIIERLLSSGAKPVDSGLNDWALNPELKRLAERHGYSVDVNGPDWMGFPALVDACRGNHNQPDDPARVQRLLDAGADVNALDAKGKSALHRAAQAGFMKIPSVLLQSGADINRRDPNGETPIFDAVRGGRVATARLLIKAGADLHARNRQGRTASVFAARLRGPQRDEILTLVSPSND